MKISKKIRHHIFAYSLFILLIILYFIVYGKKPFLPEQPGELSSAHSFLNGKCASCHDPTKPSFEDKCSSCHKEIKIKHIEKDFHYNLTKKMVCIGCHQEHQGDKTNLVRWQMFDHNQTRFYVKGYHRYQKCSTCHKSVIEKRTHLMRKQKTPLRTLYKIRNFTCYACHKKDDKHKGKFSRNCEKCHPQNSRWDE